MSQELKAYSCFVAVDAGTYHTVLAESPEAAVEMAHEAHGLQFGSLCHQCANELEVADIRGVIVSLGEFGDVLNTTLEGEQINRLEINLAAEKEVTAELATTAATFLKSYREFEATGDVGHWDVDAEIEVIALLAALAKVQP